jgi:hypothetical protein
MPICPECRTPYEPGVVLCRHCRVPLVDWADAPPPGTAPGGEGDEDGVEWVELVEVRTVPDTVTAAMWKGALESQGLHPVIRPHAIPAYGEVLRDWTTRAWGSLRVPADELAEARLVLDDFLATAASHPETEDDEEPGLDDRAGDP